METNLKKPVNLNEIEKCVLTHALLGDEIIDLDFDNIIELKYYIQTFYITPEDEGKLSSCLDKVLVAFYETDNFQEEPEYLITRDWIHVIHYFGNTKLIKNFNIFEFETYEEASIYVKDLCETSSKGLN